MIRNGAYPEQQNAERRAMGMNIDDALASLAGIAPHRGLVGLEDRVLGAIANRAVSGLGAGATMTAISLSLALGVASNVMPSFGAQAAPALSPLGAPSPLAPSTLLVGTR
jgi:hypothetical protein